MYFRQCSENALQFLQKIRSAKRKNKFSTSDRSGWKVEGPAIIAFYPDPPLAKPWAHRGIVAAYSFAH